MGVEDAGIVVAAEAEGGGGGRRGEREMQMRNKVGLMGTTRQDVQVEGRGWDGSCR